MYNKYNLNEFPKNLIEMQGTQNRNSILLMMRVRMMILHQQQMEAASSRRQFENARRIDKKHLQGQN